MSEAYHRMAHWMHSVGEFVTPLRTESAFLNKGVLTPEEFIAAGDQLVFKCPTWSWASGDKNARRSYLPSNKQYLVTKNVPCYARVASLDENFIEETEVEKTDIDADGWLSTEFRSAPAEDDITDNAEDSDDEELIVCGTTVVTKTYTTSSVSTKKTTTSSEVEGEVTTSLDEIKLNTSSDVNASTTESNDDGYEDMCLDDMVDHSLLTEANDESTLTSLDIQNSHRKDVEAAGDDSATHDLLMKTRTYDVSITYDKYYQTPRIWLSGYDSDDRPLLPKEMFEDIMSDYAKKTVTVDPHPHLASSAGYQASIHPCMHAATMKRILNYLVTRSEVTETDGDGGPVITDSVVEEDAGENKRHATIRADEYLFIFLKFIQGVVPTINYDFTLSVEVK